MISYPHSIGVLIPTYQGEKTLEKALIPLLKVLSPSQILIIDSSSTDNTKKIAEKWNVPFKEIEKSTFNHGLTRELGRSLLPFPIQVMITQDAVLEEDALYFLTQPLIEKKADVAYGKQHAGLSKNPFEIFPRSFNYTDKSHIRSLSDFSLYGSYTFFCSNSFAAYTKEALDSIQGFPFALFGEDTLAVASLLKNGKKIAYVAEAKALHCHDHTLKQEFKRHFDIGVSRISLEKITGPLKDTKRGKEFTKQFFSFLSKEKPLLLPYAFIQTACKWLGYQLGKQHAKLPKKIIPYLSSQPQFWKF